MSPKSDAMDKNLRQQTTKFLRSHGYDSVDDLDKAITDTAEGQPLKDLEEMKTKLVPPSPYYIIFFRFVYIFWFFLPLSRRQI